MSEITSSDSYKSILKPSTGIYKELGSKFLSFAYPVICEEETKELVHNIKKSHFDAKHHCFAYRIGIRGDLWRVNDDGEPSSSAGKPIYGQLLSKELSDILVIVVRYFGGTKLGIPGLIRAYRSAAADAIANSEIIEKRAGEIISFNFEYFQINQIMKLLKDYSPDVLEQNFDNICTIKTRVRLNDLNAFIFALQEIEGVSIIR